MRPPGCGEELAAELQQNRSRLMERLGQHSEVTHRDLMLPDHGGRELRGLLVYAADLVDEGRLERSILWPLVAHGVDVLGRGPNGPAGLPVGRVRRTGDLDEVAASALKGEVALLVEGQSEALLLDVARHPGSPAAQAQTEPSVHGPQEAFTTRLDVNLGLVRSRLPSPRLTLERRVIGSLTRTDVALVYLAGSAPPGLVEQTRRHLARVNPVALLGTEELITTLCDRPNSWLPTVLITERPDTVARYLVGGRVAVLADRSPKAVLLPGLLLDMLSAPDDFLELRPFAVLVRSVRMLALFIAIFLPGLYVSVTSYHLEALPTLVTLSLVAQREGAPLPAPVEALAMLLTFEVLREAGLRLPRAVGPAVSIVGGLVIGEAVMRAGLASPAMVLVVVATAVATFAVPGFSLANAATVFRLLILLGSSVFGFFGVLLGWVLLLAYLANLTSGRVPYATPFMPLRPGDLEQAYAAAPRPPHGPGPTPDPALARPAGRRRRGRP